MDLENLLNELEARWATGRRGLMVGHHNLHSLALCQSDPEVRAFYRQCDYCYVDGLPVLWLMRFAGVPTRNASRFTLMDCFAGLLGWLEARGRRLFYLGGSRATIERGQVWLSAHFPTLNFELQHGYFDDGKSHDASAKIIERINRFAPDMLLVGMGMPRQEQWMLSHYEEIEAGALLQVGGTLDYYTGLQARPPIWMSRKGLAGVYRLVHSPHRLGRRYLIEPWRLAGPVLRLRRTLRETRDPDV